MFCCAIIFVLMLITALAASGAITRETFQLGSYDPNLYASEITRNV